MREVWCSLTCIVLHEPQADVWKIKQSPLYKNMGNLDMMYQLHELAMRTSMNQWRYADMVSLSCVS